MTGREMLNQALSLLGYSEENGNSHLTQVIRNRALPIVNIVNSELARTCGAKLVPLKSLDDELNLPERALSEVMPSGVALYIAQAEGDNAAQAFWAAEYNAKRVTLSHFDTIEDVIPTVDG